MQNSSSDRLLGTLLSVSVLGFFLTIYGVFQERAVGPGDTAPQFSVVTDSGKTITRSNFGGKVLVLNFWATWCPPCIEEMPSLNQFAMTMKDKGVVVLGVSIDRNEKAYKSFVQRAQLAFPTALDPEANISSEYGSFKWPETYIIDSSGTVRQKHIGPKDWMSPEIMNPIKALL
jgi:cytochrome c biogenesis protein CcmG, thiol:disulfide interchange protein DsbE